MDEVYNPNSSESEHSDSPERIVLNSKTDSLVVKQLVPEDAQAVFEAIDYDRDHVRQSGDNTADMFTSPDKIREIIQNPDYADRYMFGIWEGDTLVGSNVLIPIGEGSADLGYWVGAKYTGHGYASRALSLTVDFAFKHLGLAEVACDTIVGNEASGRTAENAGFTLTEAFEHNGKHYLHYVLNNPEAYQVTDKTDR